MVSLSVWFIFHSHQCNFQSFCRSGIHSYTQHSSPGGLLKERASVAGSTVCCAFTYRIDWKHGIKHQTLTNETKTVFCFQREREREKCLIKDIVCLQKRWFFKHEQGGNCVKEQCCIYSLHNWRNTSKHKQPNSANNKSTIKTQNTQRALVISIESP